jgi:hypothetical protein
MPSFKFRKFQTVDEANLFVNGGIVGGKSLIGYQGGLVGAVLTFTTPNVAVTFTTGALAGTLTFAEIKAQIEAASALLSVIPVGEGRIGIVEKAPSAGVVLADTGAATKTALGFPADAAVTGKVYTYSASNTAPCVAALYFDTASGSHVVTTWE